MPLNSSVHPRHIVDPLKTHTSQLVDNQGQPSQPVIALPENLRDRANLLRDIILREEAEVQQLLLNSGERPQSDIQQRVKGLRAGIQTKKVVFQKLAQHLNSLQKPFLPAIAMNGIPSGPLPGAR
jgi:hypothetical protein